MTTSLKKESQASIIQPPTWCEYNELATKGEKAHEFIKSPVCQDAEKYFLLYIMKLHELYGDKDSFPENILADITVYPYKRKGETLQDAQYRVGVESVTALALRKTVLKDTEDKEYHLGLGSLLVINTQIAGLLCGNSKRSQIPKNGNKHSAQVKRALTFNPHWINESLNNATVQTSMEFSFLNPQELKLYYKAQYELSKRSYMKLILSYLVKMGIPVNISDFIKNSKALDVSGYKYE